MDDRHMMRASDADRQDVVERLRTALDDGRLKMDEYLDRIGRAYDAVTYGDLAPLYADLPDTGSMVKPAAAPLAPAPQPLAARPGVLTGMPVALKVLWTIWLAAVSINVVVWVLVSGTTGHLIYPWPLWVAGPSGAALFAVSAGVRQMRRSRPPIARRLTAGKD
jgi:DUF1707 SHOCT-like domain